MSKMNEAAVEALYEAMKGRDAMINTFMRYTPDLKLHVSVMISTEAQDPLDERLFLVHTFDEHGVLIGTSDCLTTMWPAMAEFIEQIPLQSFYNFARGEVINFITNDDSTDYYWHSKEYGRSTFGATWELNYLDIPE